MQEAPQASQIQSLIVSDWECDDAICAATMDTKAPLPISRMKTSTPHFFPSTRPTFVAPTFPLPTLRRFTPRRRAMISPNGIPPTR